MAATRAEPLSIESLLQKQKAEKEAASKVCIARNVLDSETLMHFTAQILVQRRTRQNRYS